MADRPLGGTPLGQSQLTAGLGVAATVAGSVTLQGGLSQIGSTTNKPMTFNGAIGGFGDLKINGIIRR